MNVSDLELFKKSKIIEIGSVKKSYGVAKLEVFGENPEIPRFSYLKSGGLDQKLSGTMNISRISKFCAELFVTQFLCYRHNIWRPQT